MTSLRTWLSKVENLGDLKKVVGADPHLEIGLLTAENTKRCGPALLFHEIPGCAPSSRLLTTALRTPRRISLALNLDPLCESEDELVRHLEGKPVQWEEQARHFEPLLQDSGPILENVVEGGDVDLCQIPAPTWHEEDGGQYIGTGCVVIMKDPDSGCVNLGCYRGMIQSKDTMTVYISPGKHGQLILQKYHDKGKACPMAVCLGPHPLLLIAATLNVPEEVSEYNYAGAMGNMRFPVLRGEKTGLPLPADAEMVLEGTIAPDQLAPEGPFGEWTGYNGGGRRNAPLFRVERILHRDAPIVIGCSPAARGDQYEVTYWFALFRSATLKSALKGAGIPGVKSVWAHELGGARQLLAVSIKQEYPGQAKQAAYVASQCREGAYAGRYVVVLDDDIDPSDIKEVVWALCTRTDPERDIEIIKRCWSTRLDPSPSRDTVPEANAYFNSRAVIDACIPFEELKTFPKRNTYSAQYTSEITDKSAGILPVVTKALG